MVGALCLIKKKETKTMVYKKTTQQDYVFTDIIEDSLISEKNKNKYLVQDNDFGLDLIGDSPVIFYAPKWDYTLLNTDQAFEPYIVNDSGDSVLHENILAILPIYGYVHSGVSINAGYNRYHCAWDSGQIGYAYITKESAKDFGLNTSNIEELENSIISTTNVVDQVYQGEVYSIVCEYLDNNGIVTDYETYGGVIGLDHALTALKEDY